MISQTDIQVDRAGRIRSIDEQLCAKLTGLRPEDVVNLPIDSFLAPEARKSFRDWLNSVTAETLDDLLPTELLSTDGKRIAGGLRALTDALGDVPSTASRSARDILLRLAATVSSPIGDDFMNELILEACEALEVAGALIARPTSSNLEGVETWAYVYKGEVLDNVQYDLQGTPCELVMYGEGIVCPSGVQARFPDDFALVEHELQSYAGAPLESSSGEYLGLLAIFDTEPMEDPGTMKSAVEILAARIAAELERRTVEQHLRRTRRMESLGQLAGGIAHDFNNILTIIISTTDLLLESGPGDTTHFDDDILAIRQAATSASELTENLLSFSSRASSTTDRVDINAQIESIFEVLGRLLSCEVDAQFDLSPAAGYVLIDPDQLEQLLLNIVANASDAMPDGGTLTVSTRPKTVTEDSSPTSVIRAEPGEYIVVSIADNGLGMKPDTVARIFEPFYTTKRKDGGTGLGLATVYGVTKQAGGGLRVETELGKGTTFEILLKSVNPPSDFAGDSNQERPETEPRRILLVEDERKLGLAARRILESVGHEVSLFHSPMEALQLLESDPNCVDVLLTDIVMPEMRGFELARRARSLKGDIDLLFMSGYANASVRERHDFADSSVFLTKPFGHDELLDALKRTIRSSENQATPPLP